MLQILRAFWQSLGFVPRRKGKSVLVWVANLDALARLEPILAELYRRNPRVHFYRVSPSSAVRLRLAAQGSTAGVLAPPAQFGPAMRLFLRRPRAQLLLLADEPDQRVARLIDHAATRDIAVVAVRFFEVRPGSSETAGPEGWRSRVDLFVTFDAADADALRRHAIDPTKVLRLDPRDDRAASAIVDAMQPLIAARRMPLGSAGSDDLAPTGWVPALLSSSLLSPLIHWKYQRIDTLEALRTALGEPETIMCLGNGPSSEDPRLRDLSYDALFRVNHFWQPRGVLTEPDVVFTGLRATIKAIRKPSVFVFQTREEEQKLMLKCLAMTHRIVFATAERLGVMDFDSFGVFQPTNGAVMLATAVALQPKRLIVAGVDLFQHPAGSYPGNSGTPNAYAVHHDRETELQFILSTFDRFEGELVILSEVLDGYWQAYVGGRQDRTASAGL
jgi:hypothetical protein